jgi:hypothetical protein
MADPADMTMAVTAATIPAMTTTPTCLRRLRIMSVLPFVVPGSIRVDLGGVNSPK